MFFNYESDAECAACGPRCRHGYMPPQTPEYARIARCHASLNHLQSSIFCTWGKMVERGESPLELTKWLVEIARVLPQPVASETLLYETAIDCLNDAACKCIRDCGGTIPPLKHGAAIVRLLQATHAAAHQGRDCAATISAVLEALQPNSEALHYLLLNVILFAPCIDGAEPHARIVDAVLQHGGPAQWENTIGALSCVLRAAKAPEILIPRLFERRLTSYLLPPCKFDALGDVNTYCNPDGARYWKRKCTHFVDALLPMVVTPFNAYALLFGRVDELPFSSFERSAELLHSRAPRRKFAAAEAQCAASKLLSLLLQGPTALAKAQQVVEALPRLFPADLVSEIPAKGQLYGYASLPVQLALAGSGVVAVNFTLRSDLFSGDFLDSKLKLALLLRHYGVVLCPVVERQCFYRLLITVITSREADAPYRFMELCKGDVMQRGPSIARFMRLALRTMYLYNCGDTTTAATVLATVAGLNREMCRVAEAARPLTLPFALRMYPHYPRSCTDAIMAFVHCLRSPKTGLPCLPAEMVLRILESAASVPWFGSNPGPSADGEQFPVNDEEIRLLQHHAFFPPGHIRAV